LRTKISLFQWVSENLADAILILAATIAVMSYVVAELLELQKFEVPLAILLFLLTTISLFIIHMAFKNDNSFSDINETLEQTKNDSNEFKRKFVEIHSLLDKAKQDINAFKGNFVEIHDAYRAQGEANGLITDSIKEMKIQLDDLKRESNAKVRELDSQPVFYRELKKQVLLAEKKVWLMHLDPYAPDSVKNYNDKSREDYFDACKKMAQDQNGVSDPVDFRRIINIPTMEKLEWTEKLIESTKNLQNLHLAYIYVDDIENSFPVSITSCQIMDDNAVFLLNPELNVVPGGTFKKCILIENQNVVKVYEAYYNRIWEELQKSDSKLGCIIKDGPGTEQFTQNKQRIIDNIKKQAPKVKKDLPADVSPALSN